MNKQRPFRFGVLVQQARSKEDWVATPRKAQSLGYSTLLVSDHLADQLAPVPSLLAAAEATDVLRIGSFVFGNDFRHPVMLTKEAATLDLLSDGRFELGMGTGFLRSDYDQAGLPYDPAGVRVSRMEEALHIIKGLFADGPLTFSGTYYTVTALEGHPKPLQRPYPPILIGGGGKRVLSIAAREATIVSFVPIARPDGSAPELTDATSAALTRKIAWVRQAAGDRFDDLELNIPVTEVVVTEDREQAAQFIASTLASGLSIMAKQVLEVPYLLIGTVDQICEDVLARREQYGISYITVYEKNMEALAPVVARLSG
jgi:probable F420-dependent oxidoreductase